MTPFFVPYLDVSVEEATVMTWLKRVGDPVDQGESLVELATEKALFEFESPASGTLLAQLFPSKSTVTVGACLGYIGIPGETLPLEPPVSPLFAGELTDVPAAAETDVGEIALEMVPESPLRVRATPRARRLARESGISLEAVQSALGVEVVDEEAVRRFCNQK